MRRIICAAIAKNCARCCHSTFVTSTSRRYTSFTSAVVWSVIASRSFLMCRRAIARNSGYTYSANRARAASSPLLQAFSKPVISEDDAPDDEANPLFLRTLVD